MTKDEVESDDDREKEQGGKNSLKAAALRLEDVVRALEFATLRLCCEDERRRR